MSRRKREKRRERIQQLREQLEAEVAVENEPAKASEIIFRFSFIKPGHRGIVTARVTSPGQKRNGNLAGRASFLRAEVEAVGGIVVASVEHQGRGDDPSWLKEAVALARKYRADFIVAESTDRFIRPEYTDFDERALPGRADFDKLRRCTGGFPLVTFKDPDEPYERVKRQDAIRGGNQKQRKGGRPTNEQKSREQREARKREQWALRSAVKKKYKQITPN